MARKMSTKPWAIQLEYDDPANWLFYDSEEGGYQGETWSTHELLWRLGFELPNDDGRLWDELVRHIDPSFWCKRHPYGVNGAELAQYSWERFSEITKHKRRFFFREDSTHDHDLLGPEEILTRIIRYAGDVGLFRYLPSDMVLYRARQCTGGESFTTFQELGPPPLARCNKSNRMSPAGIVMFYCSDSAETALRETAKGFGTFSVGRFSARRPVAVLDLTNLPAIPSLFAAIPDTAEVRPRDAVRFLHQVAEAISAPIAPDSNEHIEYVPTQIVTEFVRSNALFKGRAIDGIRFESARHPGRSSLVLFATQDNFVGAGPSLAGVDQWLELVGMTNETVAPQC